MTEAPCVTELGAAPTDVCDGVLVTPSVVVPVDPAKVKSPEYAPEIVSVPTGAADEVQVPVPFTKFAVHSVVVPVVNETDPVGVGFPLTLVVTVAEYVTVDPTATGPGGFTLTAVCEGSSTTRLADPSEPV